MEHNGTRETRSRWTRKRLLAIAATVAVIIPAGVVTIEQSANAAGGALKVAANLDQCQNGAKGPPIVLNPCRNGALGSTSYSDWVNGNVNGSKAHWNEGDFLTYRAKLTGLSGAVAGAPSSHTLVFQYDTVHGGKHAIDYIGSFDADGLPNGETTSATATDVHRNNNNPCMDILLTTGCAATDLASNVGLSGTVPAAGGNLDNCGGSLGTFAGSQQMGVVKVFAPTGAQAAAVDVQNVTLHGVQSGGGQCSSAISVRFTLNGPPQAGGYTVVLAWGGHIASQYNWQSGNSATSITGSPYHMALNTLDGVTLGSQDRALSTSAIIQVNPTITTSLSGGTQSGLTITVPPGTAVTDTATLVGASATAAGTVTYNVYTNSTCNSLNPLSFGPMAVSAGVPASSGPQTFGTPGATYYWQVTYTGDGLNQPTTSLCNEILTFSRAPSTIVTAQDLIPDDTANIGVTDASGPMRFRLFATGDCSGDPIFDETVTGPDSSGTWLTTNHSAATPVHVNTAGTYRWLVDYDGDTQNAPSTSTCGTEQFTIQNAPPSP